MILQTILNKTINPRKVYDDYLQKTLGTHIIKVVTGMRRSGKSYLLQSLIQHIVSKKIYSVESVFYINKEAIQFDHIRDYHDLYTEIKNHIEGCSSEEKIFICIDEVQEISQREKAINSIFFEYNTRVDIYISGSNSKMLSSELSTLLTGRYIEIEVFPLSFSEYVTYADKKHSLKTFDEYIHYGGLPGIFEFKGDEQLIRNYHTAIYTTILLKDIVKYFGVRNVELFEDLYKYVLSNISNVISAKSIHDYLKSQKIGLSVDRIMHYLEYGIDIFLINRAKSFNPQTKKFFQIYNKYYVRDLGLRNNVVGYIASRDKGALLENFVYNELIRNGYQVRIGRLSDSTEIDFIATKDTTTKYFQVAYTVQSPATYQREFGNLLKIPDNHKKYIITYNDPLQEDQGIESLPAYKLDSVL